MIKLCVIVLDWWYWNQNIDKDWENVEIHSLVNFYIDSIIKNKPLAAIFKYSIKFWEVVN